MSHDTDRPPYTMEKIMEAAQTDILLARSMFNASVRFIPEPQRDTPMSAREALERAAAICLEDAAATPLDLHWRFVALAASLPEGEAISVPRETLARWANEEFTATPARWTKFRNDIRTMLAAAPAAKVKP